MSKLPNDTKTSKNGFIEEVLTFAHLRKEQKNKTDLNAF